MRTAFIFIASLLTIVAALWLRLAKGDPLRENITKIHENERFTIKPRNVI
jgi:hypothetical protein